MLNSKIKIAIADDHQVSRFGLAAMLDSRIHELVGEAGNGHEIIDIVKNKQVDIVFMDIEMPKLDGIAATKIINESIAGVGIIALSMHKDSPYLIKMIDAGALGYLSKTANKKEVLEAINTVSNNKSYYCREASKSMSELIVKRNNIKLKNVLNENEIKIVRLLCEEYNSDEIGKMLFLSKRTIDGARLRIQNKLNVSSTAGIVKYAITNGIYREKD
jgi:DNA-binding NarL/FixJ family response regulator